MIVTVGQYLEALECSEGRFRSLGRVWARGGFIIPGNGLIDFEVETGDGRMFLRCPLRVDEEAVMRFRTLVGRDDGLGGRFFTEWRLLDDEILLYGDDGRPFWVDASIRPAEADEPLAEFLARADASGDWDARRAVSESCEELLQWAAAHDRCISLKRLVVTPSKTVKVTAFSAAGEEERIRSLCGGICASTDISPTFSPQYEEVTWDAYWGVAVVMSEGRWSLLDRTGKVLTVKTYDWMGDCSEGLILAVRGGKCGFVDVGGREVIPCGWDDASSFSGGVVLATHGGETFLADARGRRIGK